MVTLKWPAGRVVVSPAQDEDEFSRPRSLPRASANRRKVYPCMSRAQTLQNHSESYSSFPNNEQQARARCVTIPHRADLGAVHSSTTSERGRSSARLPPTPGTRQVGLRQTRFRYSFSAGPTRGSPMSHVRQPLCLVGGARMDRLRGDGETAGDSARCLRSHRRLEAFRCGPIDCCIAQAPCGGEMAGKSPVDRGKQGIKRSMIVDAIHDCRRYNGIPRSEL